MNKSDLPLSFEEIVWQMGSAEEDSPSVGDLGVSQKKKPPTCVGFSGLTQDFVDIRR
jgi:hypothetical protein